MLSSLADVFRKTGAKKMFNWDEREERAFQTPMEALRSRPILRVPTYHDPSVILCNDSDREWVLYFAKKATMIRSTSLCTPVES